MTSACPDFSPDPALPRSAPSWVGRLLPPGLTVPGRPRPGPGGQLSCTSAPPGLPSSSASAPPVFGPTLHNTRNTFSQSLRLLTPHQPVLRAVTRIEILSYPFYCRKTAQVSKLHFIQLNQQTTHLKHKLEKIKNHKLDQENVFFPSVGLFQNYEDSYIIFYYIQ